MSSSYTIPGVYAARESFFEFMQPPVSGNFCHRNRSSPKKLMRYNGQIQNTYLLTTLLNVKDMKLNTYVHMYDMSDSDARTRHSSC